MHPQLDIVTPSQQVPDMVDTVVIGGGIAGVTAALELAERGQRVALVEKGQIAAEQSCRNWGWVRRMGRDPAEYPLGILSLGLWDTMNARVGAETGFRRTGVIYSAETEKELAVLKDHHRVAMAFGVDTQMLSSMAFTRLMPRHAAPVLGALYTPDDGRAEPAIAVPAMARAAQAAGVHLLSGCAARGLETAAGAVAGVITEKGTIRCTSAVLAGGAWSRLFAGNLGIGLPILKVRGSVLRTKALENGPGIALGNAVFGVRGRLDGGLTLAFRGGSQAQITPDSFLMFPRFLKALIETREELRLQLGRTFWDELRTPRRWSPDEPTPFESCRILNPPPSAKLLRKAWAGFQARFPDLIGLEEADRWGGMIDVTPDAVPIISGCSIPGLVLSTGYSGHGFGIGPGAGRLAADLVLGATPCVDPAPFRLDRFGRVWAPRGARGLRERPDS